MILPLTITTFQTKNKSYLKFLYQSHRNPNPHQSNVKTRTQELLILFSNPTAEGCNVASVCPRSRLTGTISIKTIDGILFF